VAGGFARIFNHNIFSKLVDFLEKSLPVAGGYAQIFNHTNIIQDEN
jgi:hypothetical protein